MKVDEYNLGKLMMFIEYAVRWAEQIYTPEQNLKKKEKVYGRAKVYLQQLGLDLTDDQLDTIVEGMVNEVKKK